MQPRIKIKSIELDGIRKLLSAVPRKDPTPQDITKSQAVRQLLPDILELQAKGHDLVDIARLLSQNGLPVSMWTIKNILVEAEKKDGGDHGRNRREVSASLRRDSVCVVRDPARARAKGLVVARSPEPSAKQARESCEIPSEQRSDMLPAAVPPSQSGSQSTSQSENQSGSQSTSQSESHSGSRSTTRSAQVRSEPEAIQSGEGSARESPQARAVAASSSAGDRASSAAASGRGVASKAVPAATESASQEGRPTERAGGFGARPGGGRETPSERPETSRSAALPEQDGPPKPVRRSTFVVRPDSERI